MKKGLFFLLLATGLVYADDSLIFKQKQEENIKLDDLTENALGEWEVLFRLESVEDLEKIFSSSKKVDENLGDSK